MYSVADPGYAISGSRFLSSYFYKLSNNFRIKKYFNSLSNWLELFLYLSKIWDIYGYNKR
jgi:hypothetical protein